MVVMVVVVVEVRCGSQGGGVEATFRVAQQVVCVQKALSDAGSSLESGEDDSCSRISSSFLSTAAKKRRIVKIDSRMQHELMAQTPGQPTLVSNLR